MLDTTVVSLILTFWSPTVAGVDLDAIVRRVVQSFHHANTGGFLLSPLESRKCNISYLPNTLRTSPATTGNWTSITFNEQDEENGL